MGKMIYLKCNKNGEHCDNLMLGCGKGLPIVYKQVINSIKKGKYGAEIKNFLKENPKGVIDCSKVIVECPKCKHYDVVYDLSMYIPKKNNSFYENKNYVFPRWLKRDYKKVKSFKHICSKCSTEMKTVKIKEDDCGEIIKIKKLKCPKCTGLLEWNGDCSFWD